MRGDVRLGAISVASAGLAGAVAGYFPDSAAAPLARNDLVPDLLSLAGERPATFANVGLTAVAGAIIGLAMAAAAHRRNGERAISPFDILLLANPIAVFSYSQGADAALLLAATTIVGCAAMTLARTRGYRACVVLGLMLALAPFLSNSLIYLYPALLVASPAISPWGIAPRRAAGFAVVVWSPLAMTVVSLAYLQWLLGRAIGSPFSLQWSTAMLIPLFLAVAGGVVISIAGLTGARSARLFAFLAAAGLLGWMHPDWLGAGVAQ